MYHIGAAHGSSLVVSLAEVTTQLYPLSFLNFWVTEISGFQNYFWI